MPFTFLPLFDYFQPIRDGSHEDRSKSQNTNVKGVIMVKPWAALSLLFWPLVLITTPSNAQTVSILTSSESSEAYLVEAAMKRNLREEGYTVKGGTAEGFVLLVQVLPLKSQGGYASGVAGAVTIGHLQWQAFADLMVSPQCKEEHQTAQNLKEILGGKLMLIDATMAYGGDEERLAELLSTFANREIRKASAKIAELFEAIQRHGRPDDSEVISPTR